MSFDFTARGTVENILAHLRHILAHLEGRDGSSDVSVSASGDTSASPSQSSVTIAPAGDSNQPAGGPGTDQAAPSATENPPAQENPSGM